MDHPYGHNFRIDPTEDLISWEKEYSYRCDSFKSEHDSLHLLFGGCSFTAGEGLSKEDTWAYKVYQKANEKYGNTDGYYNVAVPGIAISEAIDQVFKYIRKYGVPDAVFLLLPDLGREGDTVGDDYNRIMLQAYRTYLYLDTFLKTAGSQLYSFTWVRDIRNFGDHILPDKNLELKYPGEERKRPSWREQIKENSSPTRVLQSFDTYYTYDPQVLVKEVFRHHITTNNKDPLSLVAADLGAHPGKSFHDFYADFIFDKFAAKNSGVEFGD